MKRGMIVCLAAIAVCGVTVTAIAQNIKEPTPERIDAVTALIGNQLSAKPAKARRVLVFWRCEDFVHGDSIALGNKAFEIAAHKTKAFTVEFSREYDALRPENLAKFDALVLNNTTHLKTDTPENSFVEPALIEFVRSGKGLTLIHAAVDNFKKSDVCAEMTAGFFWGHPWGAGGTWAFKVEEPDHACCVHSLKALAPTFKFSDEIYQHKPPFYNRAKLRILVSLDFSDKPTATAKGQQRKDNDYAVSWVRPYGKGRVFYTSFAHDHRAWMHREILQHIFDGLQYTLGDLKADDTPGGLNDNDLALVKKAADEAGYIEAFTLLQDILTHTGVPAVDAANIAKLQNLLKDPQLTVFGKKAILRALALVNASVDVTVVAPLVQTPETRAFAVQLLTGTPGAAAERALTAALGSAPAAIRPELLAALAIRKQSAAILPYLKDNDKQVAAAAMAALGRVADKQALDALAREPTVDLKPIRDMALSAALGTMAERGETRATTSVAKEIFNDAKAAPALRAAAARALLTARSDFFEAGMADSCPIVRSALLRNTGKVSAGTLAGMLKKSAVSDQPALIARLAEKEEKSTAAAVAEMLASPDEDVVLASLRALKSIGGKEQVPAIFTLLEREGRVRDMARETLSDMRDKTTTSALLVLAGSDIERQKKTLPLIGERLEPTTLDLLPPFMQAENDDVRKEAWKAAGKIANEKSVAKLFSWLKYAQQPEGNLVENALRQTGRNADTLELTRQWKAAWQHSATPAKMVLANLAVGYGSDELVAPLTAALKVDDANLRETAARALGNWPNSAPLNALMQAVNGGGNENQLLTTLQAALKLNMAHSGDDFTKNCVELFRKAHNERAQTAVADTIFKRDGLNVFNVLQGLFNDPTAGAAAKRSYTTLYDNRVKGKADISEIEPKVWKANASHNGREADRAFDRNPDTRWSSNKASERDMWFTLDLGENRFVAEAILDTEGSGNDTPNGCEVFVSGDGKNWSGPVATIDGSSKKRSVIPLSVETRHLKFVTTGERQGLHWSIHELYLKAGLDPKQVQAIEKVAASVR